MMTDALREELKRAIDGGFDGYACYLCERLLAIEPNHLATLADYAKQLIEVARYDDALAAIDQAEKIASDKHRPWLAIRRGRALKRQGKLQAAEKEFLRATELDTEEATGWIFAAGVAWAQGDVERAMRFAKNGTLCNHGHVDEAFYILGGCHLGFGEYEAAADCYRSALEIDPDYEAAKQWLEDVDLILRHTAEERQD
jgi:tetratricopeptide (TPR) repeat protein